MRLMMALSASTRLPMLPKRPPRPEDRPGYWPPPFITALEPWSPQPPPYSLYGNEANVRSSPLVLMLVFGDMPGRHAVESMAMHSSNMLLGCSLAFIVFDDNAAILAPLEQNVDVAGKLTRDVLGIGSGDDDILITVVSKVHCERVGTSSPALQVDERVLLINVAGFSLHEDDALLGDTQKQFFQPLLALGLPLAAVVGDTVGLERPTQLHVAVLGIDLMECVQGTFRNDEPWSRFRERTEQRERV